MCFLFVCWLCFDKHGSCEDTLTSRAARRFPVVGLACTLAEEFFVGQPLFRGILSVLRIRVRHRDVSFLFCVSRNAFCCVARPSVDLHRWTKETLGAGSWFDQRSKSLPRANGCTLILSLSCYGARRSCRDDAKCCWETRKHAIGVVVALFPMCPLSVVGVKFCFVSVFVSLLLWL